MNLNDLAIPVVLGLLLAVVVIRMLFPDMNVRRGVKRNTQDVLYYEDMTPEQKREYGFIPKDELPSEWQDFYNRSGKKGRR